VVEVASTLLPRVLATAAAVAAASVAPEATEVVATAAAAAALVTVVVATATPAALVPNLLGGKHLNTIEIHALIGATRC
jgi:P pilus assembly chaperone PapD